MLQLMQPCPCTSSWRKAFIRLRQAKKFVTKLSPCAMIVRLSKLSGTEVPEFNRLYETKDIARFKLNRRKGKNHNLTKNHGHLLQ